MYGLLAVFNCCTVATNKKYRSVYFFGLKMKILSFVIKKAAKMDIFSF